MMIVEWVGVVRWTVIKGKEGLVDQVEGSRHWGIGQV